MDASTAFDLYLSEVPVRARYDREVGASPRCLRKELAAVIGRAVPALGAARAVASLVSGKPPPAWRDKVIENVRNEAVHMGRYPSPGDAENLCREVATKIVEFEKLLSTQKCVNEAPFYMKLYLEDAEDAGALPPGLRTLWFSSGLLFETGGARESDSVDAHLSEYKNSPDWEKQTWV